MGFRGPVQLDHVALQVLLLHELLGAGGTLKEKTGPVRSGATGTILPPGSQHMGKEGLGPYTATVPGGGEIQPSVLSLKKC